MRGQSIPVLKQNKYLLVTLCIIQDFQSEVEKSNQYRYTKTHFFLQGMQLGTLATERPYGENN